MIRILLVDDQNLILQGIQVLLDNDPNFKIIGIAKDGRTAVEQAEKLQPDIVLIDLEMPKMNGIVATEYLSCLVPQAKVIVLTSHEREQYLMKALKAGAKGYLLKNSSAKDLKRAILTVNQGYSQIESKLLAKVVKKRKASNRASAKLIAPAKPNKNPAENAIIKKPATLPKKRKSYRQTKFSNPKGNYLAKLLDKKPSPQRQLPSVVNRASLAPIFETSTAITKTVPPQKRSQLKYSPVLSVIKLFKFKGLGKILLLALGVIILLFVLYGH